MSHRPAPPRRPVADRRAPRRAGSGRRSFRAALRRAALPLALVASAGATIGGSVGCRSDRVGPLRALAETRVAVGDAAARGRDALSGRGKVECADIAAAKPARTVADPFRAAEQALAAADTAAPATPPAAASKPAAGPAFADDFEAKLAALRGEAGRSRPRPHAPAGGVAFAAVDERTDDGAGGVTDAGGEDAFAAAFADSDTSDDLAAAPTSPADLFADAPADPAEPAAPPELAAEALFSEAEAPPPWDAAPTPPPAGFDPFAGDGGDPFAGLRAPAEADADDLLTPFPPVADEDALAAPPAAAVYANGGLPPGGGPAGEQTAPPPFDAAPVLTADAPELTFGRPPLPPKPDEKEVNVEATLSLAAPTAAPTAAAEAAAPGEAEPEEDDALLALAAPVAEEPADDPADATLPVAEKSPEEPALAAPALAASEPLPAAPAAPVAAPRRGRPGIERLPRFPDAGGRGPAVELGAAEVDSLEVAETASPAAPLTAGLGLGAVLLVGLSLWRRRAGLG